MAGPTYFCAGVFVLVLASAAAASGQGTAQATTPAQTTLYGVCSYKTGGTYYHTTVLTEPMTARNDVQHQFLLYINSQTPTTAKIGAGCRWSLTQAEVTKGLAMIEQTSSVKQAVIPWQYNPAASQTAASANGRAQTVAGQTVATQTGNGVSSAQTAAGTTGTGTGIGSIGSTTTDSLKSAGSNASSTVAGSVNTMTTSGVNDMTNAATSAVGNLFHRKKSGGGGSGTTTDAGAAQPTQVAANAPAGDPAAKALVATPAAGAGAPADSLPAAGGVSFFACHLKANGTAYYSEIFPAAPTDQAPATMAFWRQVAHQYKISNIPFSNNAACDPAASDAAAATTLQAAKAANGKGIDTGWAYMGDGK